MKLKVGKPVYFETPADLRRWFEKNHATEEELWVGYYKRDSGKPSITWPESVDQALCFGWIDAVRKSLGETQYTIRFTRRKPTSTWSAVNIERVADLTKNGLMKPAGLKAFEIRREAKSKIYSYEQKTVVQLEPAEEKQFKSNKAAWAFFQEQPAWYKKAALWSVISAKREETRRKRLAQLIADSANGRTIRSLTRP